MRLSTTLSVLFRGDFLIRESASPDVANPRATCIRFRLGLGVGLWCRGSTAPRQGRRCGFESRQVHSLGRYFGGVQHGNCADGGAVLMTLKFLDRRPGTGDNELTLTGCKQTHLRRPDSSGRSSFFVPKIPSLVDFPFSTPPARKSRQECPRHRIRSFWAHT